MPSFFDRLFKGKPPHAPDAAHRVPDDACDAPAANAAPAAANAAGAFAGEDYEAAFAQALSVAAAGNVPRALELFERAIAADPSRAEAHYKRGNMLKDLGKLEAAVSSYGRAVELDPTLAYAYCNRGSVQQALGRHVEALDSYDRAIAVDPRDRLSHYNRALLLQELHHWDEALAAYERAIALDPHFADAQYNRAVLLLYLGDFAQGWRSYEWRWRNAERLGIGAVRELPQPRWTGESLDGKRLLLYAEAGLGDTLQFCRYATLCAARGAEVILEVQKPLVEVVSRLEGVSQVIARGGLLPPFDYEAPLMSLPLAFGTTVDTVPAPGHYLRAEEERIAGWRSRLGPRTRPRVGLAWSGNPRNPIDVRRSIALADWVPHLPPEFQYVCLQTEVRASDQEALDDSEILAFDADDMDFPQTAALCACMDVIVTIDTSIAHLAGALGLPTCLLLSHTPDWRWLRERSDTPWYPSMTLYRQPAPGDWRPVFARVSAELRNKRVD